MSILLDTGFIIASFNKRDRHHRWASRLMREVLEGRWGPPYTTDYIIDEVLSYAAARLPGDAGLKLGELLLEKRILHIIPVTLDIVLEAWRVYKSHYPGLSFTDSTSIVVAKTYGIDYIATVETSGLLPKLHPSLTPYHQQ
ncbi:PilT protein domain protein [Pyrolobus fumarii 1A]|uniref:PilT protein domain protein n=1 Tax=Pyrolobus fumarii (strain DSM 11204 / 1A) TaxID=694429 RepID=G0EFH5_PYRF1|nr:PIN domain-containing protein [Pyrolobus fumarii]AEM38999.1 PilT protein domain protein [Pyrolobus fumarii 1A]